MFLQHFFDDKVEVRLRPSFFPFTEPSVEIDIKSKNITGKFHNKWLEVMGAGMVDPNVYKAVGYDENTCTGFAFGIGVERMAMLRYGISDIRNFFDNDIRLLEQF